MAVSGLDKFARYFAGYEDCYTIIGGAACEILMSQTPIDYLLNISVLFRLKILSGRY